MVDRQRQAKLVLLGESAVGKSSIVKRFLQSQFSDCQEATIGAAYFTQTVICGDSSVRFEIWDTAGQERYNCLAPMYYRGAQAAIIVYDITHLDTLDKAKHWVDEIKASNIMVIAIAGNKSDLQDERKVPTQDAKAYADEQGLIFFETSAKDNTNLNELFTAVAEGCLTVAPDTPRGQQLNLGDTTNKSNQCCR